MPEKFFIDIPSATTDPHAYQYPGGPTLRWSGDFGLPAIGSKIFVTMNGIGWSTVRGFFSSEGYLGVMEHADDPPEYLIRQHRENPGTLDWQREGIGCVFATEFKPAKLGPEPRNFCVFEHHLRNRSFVNGHWERLARFETLDKAIDYIARLQKIPPAVSPRFAKLITVDAVTGRQVSDNAKRCNRVCNFIIKPTVEIKQNL
jgi:hypothetical protein